MTYSSAVGALAQRAKSVRRDSKSELLRTLVVASAQSVGIWLAQFCTANSSVVELCNLNPGRSIPHALLRQSRMPRIRPGAPVRSASIGRGPGYAIGALSAGPHRRSLRAVVGHRVDCCMTFLSDVVVAVLMHDPYANALRPSAMDVVNDIRMGMSFGGASKMRMIAG